MGSSPVARVLEFQAFVPAPLDDVFEFFSRAENLGRLTPPSMRFEILTPPPIDMRPGTLIEYRLRLHGVPLRWRSEITAWEPGRRFVDVQRRGPYRLWEHEHRFEAVDGGTLVSDTLRYVPPGGPLAPFVDRLLVRARIEEIFRYRAEAMARAFGPAAGEPQLSSVSCPSTCRAE